MKHLLTYSLLLSTFSLYAGFTRLATETYPGGGGVATNAVAGITTNGVPVALDAAKIAHLIIPEGGGPTGGVTKAYVDNATNALSLALVPRIVDAADKGTNYTDVATNELSLALVPRIVDAADKGTNYTDSAALAATNYTDAAVLAATNFVKAGYLPLAGGTMTYGSEVYMPYGKLLFDKNGADVTGLAYAAEYGGMAFLRGHGGTTYSSSITPDNSPVVTSNMMETAVSEKYLPRSAGPSYQMTNNIWFDDENSSSSIGRGIVVDTGGSQPSLKFKNWKWQVEDANYTSKLIPDNSDFITSNKLTSVLKPATNETLSAAKIYADRMGAADWNATTSYAKGNFVWYTDETTTENTGLYVASKPGTNLPPPLNPDYWTKMPDANALFSQSNAQLSKNFLPWKGGSNAYVEWQGQNVRVYNGGLFARTLDLQAGFSNLKAYEGTSPYTSLPDYLRGATWNTAADPFAKKSDVDASTLTATNFVKANYLPLAGGTMTGNLNMGGKNIYLVGENGAYISYDMAGDAPALYAVGDNEIHFYNGTVGSINGSWLKPDNSYVVTSNMLNGVLGPEIADVKRYSETNSYPFALGNMVSNTVSQWEGYWNGSNVYWSVTNYLEVGNAKIMKLYEIQTNGVHREIWNDSDKYDIFFTNTLDAVSSTNTFTREWVGTFVTNSLDAKADRAWGKYTSSGYDVPDTNMVWHTAPTTVFAGGFEFQKVAVAGGEIGVLVSQGSVPYAAGSEGKFIIGDGFGTNYFGYVKKDDYIIATRVDGITVDQATKMVTLTYDLVFSGEYPIVYYSPTVLPVTAQTWIQLNKSDGTLTPGAPWPVTFSTGAGYIKAHISFASATAEMPPEGFFTSSTAVIGGGTFKTNMKADFLDAGIMCTNTDTKVMGVIRPTFDGTTVHWNWSKQ